MYLLHYFLVVTVNICLNEMYIVVLLIVKVCLSTLYVVPNDQVYTIQILFIIKIRILCSRYDQKNNIS